VLLEVCDVVGDRPTNVVAYPDVEDEFLRAAVVERRQREADRMPDF